MPTKLVLQQRGASGLENKAEIPALENGKIDMSWLPVVGESGAAIIARGSNANGEWVRWEDGTQVCYNAFNHIFDTTQTSQNIEVTFPAAFVNANVCGAATLYAYPGARQVLTNYRPSSTKLTLIFQSYDGAPTSSDPFAVHWFAIGRWK